MVMTGKIQMAPALTHPLLCLFDYALTTTWIHHKAIPRGINGSKFKAIQGLTMAGIFSLSLSIGLENLVFPEFYRHKQSDAITARIFKADCWYNMILFGCNVLSRLGVVLEYDEHIMTWDHVLVTMRSFAQLCSMALTSPPLSADLALQLLFNAIDEDLNNDCGCGVYHVAAPSTAGPNDKALTSESGQPPTGDGYESKHIKESVYASVAIDDLVQSCSHLSSPIATTCLLWYTASIVSLTVN